MTNASVEIICIVGAGFMGQQIAYRAITCGQSLSAGHTVWLADTSAEVLERARLGLSQELQAQSWMTAEQREAALRRVHVAADLPQGVAQADLVIEAIPERLDLKRELFARLDALCPEHTILATNSSSIRIARIEDVVRRTDKVLNLHYFAPVEQRPVVELMGGTATTAQTIERVRRFALRCQLTPLIVRRDSTGFIFNRVWRAVKKECLRVVDQGVATPEDVDRAWMIVYKTPMGPFGQMDLIGLDVVRDIEMVYYEESGDPSDVPPPVLLDKIARGELGVKTGVGFYTYPHPAYEDPRWLRGQETTD